MWSGLLRPQRLTIIGSGILSLAFIGALAYLMNRVEYVPLCRDLNPEEARAIAHKLTEQKKDFIVQGSSTYTIKVAARPSEVDKLRLEIAGSGLLGSGRISYKYSDKIQFVMTDFTELVNLRTELEGALALTIIELESPSKKMRVYYLCGCSNFTSSWNGLKASVPMLFK